MSADSILEHNYGQQLSRPLHVQQLESSLTLGPFINYVEKIMTDPALSSDSSNDEAELLKPGYKDSEGNKVVNGITISKTELKADKTRLYNFTKIKKNRRWLRTILLSDSSSEDESEDRPVTQEDLQAVLKIHRHQRRQQARFYQNPSLRKYMYYSAGLLSNYDKFPEHYKSVMGPKKKITKEQKKIEKKVKAKLKKLKKDKALLDEEDDEDEIDPALLALLQQQQARKERKPKKLTPEQADAKRKKIWVSIAKKEIPKAQKQKASARKEMLSLLKKVSQQCVREKRRGALQSQKTTKETTSRARRLTREMLIYWKRFEKVEKEHRKRAEKEAQEQRKLDLELMEAKRQQRKLNFLITQTELYAHFMARKMTGEGEARRDAILNQLNDSSAGTQHRQVDGGVLVYDTVDPYDPEQMKRVALQNAESALKTHQKNRQQFDAKESLNSSLANPSSLSGIVEQPQPNIFVGKLKGYQLKGMNWLTNLYNQGINGILADEMGLGKTVQTIAFLGNLSETQGIWGPFLIIAPASTLHNWQQEITRFVPHFKVVPYWGNTQERKIMRKFWDSKSLHTENASFHVVVTSYQLVIQDVKYFQRIKWQYLVLDEAQAIKSTSSARWKTLLGFNCRNRLLLTGTPIQNSMAELWALLHFIMPTMFDSHDEFNEWFSKDIESHAEKQSGIDADQLSRLHMILKPFMLRRVKKDVENELSDKIEIMVNCPLTKRQKQLYDGIKKKISIDDLLQSATSSSSQSQTTTSSLMNLVMQFRKVCNHPELFERREARTPYFMCMEDYSLPKQVFTGGLVESSLLHKRHILYNSLYIHSPSYINHALHHRKDDSNTSCLSFVPLIDLSPQELHRYMFGGLLVRWLGVFLSQKAAYRIHQRHYWSADNNADPFRARDCLILTPLCTLSPPNLAASPVLCQLVFTHPTDQIYAHLPHTIHYVLETAAHRHIRSKHHHHRKKSHTPPTSPTKGHSSVKSPTSLDEFTLPAHPHRKRPPKVLDCMQTTMPLLVQTLVPKVQSKHMSMYCVDRSAEWVRMREALGGTLEARQSLLYGTPELAWERRWSSARLYNEPPAGLTAVTPPYGWYHVHIPDKETLVSDAGKLYILDTLLQRLKSEGHRVLIYSQMTRMIDLLEEYMVCHKHTYMRLDGSSKISDRRDMVADFQSKSDIFVFLLSTRAGGLGINLTAADTVIFYDSDWNPTVDQQAMDRAHRLGQTKQVTVYRLICQGTIEERILQRAKEKSEIQKMVISGGSYRPDTLKPTEVVSLLIDDDEMEKKLRQRQAERKEDGRKRRRKEYKKREPKKKKLESVDVNVTIPAPDTESLASRDSFSMPASPMSTPMSTTQVSWNSELTLLGGGPEDDASNDGGLVIVDDAHTTFPPVTTGPPQPVKKGRGRPRGSGVGRRPRGRGSAKKTMTAAEIAGAQAGMTAAYAAYGYNFTGTGSPLPSGSRGSSGRNTPSM